MRALFLVVPLILALATGTALAQSPGTGANNPPAALSPAAGEAVNVVNAFMAALAGNQLETARQLMTPDAVVIANGQVFGTRDTYIDGAAKGDAAALATVQRELLRRDATANDNLGLVLSEKRLREPDNPQGPSEVVTETMALVRTPAGWKIVHIHWSNRHAG